MSYHPEPGIHIRDKVKVVLDLSIYATKKDLNDAAGLDTSNLAAKSDFTALKGDKPYINKLVNVSISLHNLKEKVDDLDVDKLKNVSIDK